MQGASGSIYATIKFADDATAVSKKKVQLAKPVRISVTKSIVYVVYPLQYKQVSILST